MNLGDGKARLAVALALVAASIAAPAVTYPTFLMKLYCVALFASAFNLLLGYVGLLSFGHAMFFGMAAYVTGHAVKVWEVSPELGILAGTGVAALLGVVVGGLAIRRQGIYFSMVTLALSQMVFFFCLQASFTHGEDGIQSIPRRPVLGIIDVHDDTRFYYVVLAIFLLGYFALYRVIHSPFGQALKAIRENEARAISLGYKVAQYKLMAFTLSAAFAGLAGATKVLVFQLASLTDVTWQTSGEVVLVTLIGGVGTVFGPLVGAAIIVGMETYLADFGDWVLMIQGAIFVVVVLTFRKGVVGEVKQHLRRYRDSRKMQVPASDHASEILAHAPTTLI